LQGFFACAIKRGENISLKNPNRKWFIVLPKKKNPSLDFPRVGITSEKNFH
jgi:hypothetical protein